MCSLFSFSPGDFINFLASFGRSGCGFIPYGQNSQMLWLHCHRLVIRVEPFTTSRCKKKKKKKKSLASNVG